MEISKVSLPIKLRVGYDGDGPKTPEFATLVVDRAGTASNAAAIPQGVGNFWTVLLEGSSDLVNWTSVPPGDYAGDTPTRFFRTRIIQR